MEIATIVFEKLATENYIYGFELIKQTKISSFSLFLQKKSIKIYRKSINSHFKIFSDK